jgi:hypothetical protein
MLSPFHHFACKMLPPRQDVVDVLRDEVKQLTGKLDQANQLNADMNKQRQEMIRRAYDAELQYRELVDTIKHDHLWESTGARVSGHEDCATCAILERGTENRSHRALNCDHDFTGGWADGKQRCQKCGDVIGTELSTPAEKRIDLPECVSCKSMGKLCGYHEPKRRNHEDHAWGVCDEKTCPECIAYRAAHHGLTGE